MADHVDDETNEVTGQAAASAGVPDGSPTPGAGTAELPADQAQPVDEAALPKEPGEDPADAPAQHTADVAGPASVADPASVEDMASVESLAADEGLGAVEDADPVPVPDAWAPPVRRPEPEHEPELPRFGAQFSSPEPTTVTARPRRRATRPALAADPDSVEPPKPVTPTAPAFVTFVAPEPEVAAPRRRSRRAAAESPVEAPVEQPVVADDRDDEPAPPRRSRSRRREVVEEVPAEVAEIEDVEPVDLGVTDVDDADTDADDEDRDGEDGGASGSRRRRRGRRGRGRGRTGDDSADTESDDDAEQPAEPVAESADEPEDAADADEAEDEDSPESGSSTRRRRRRRRRGSSGEAGAEDTTEDADDRPERAGRNGRTSSDDDVRGVAGSTRLEAKRQRRREGRDGGRKRAPILSESEFLARREAVDRAMVIRQQGERTQIAVLEDDVLVEHYVTQAQATSFAGNVYLGRVQNVLPSMEAAFVDIGKGRNAVLYAGEVNWDAAGLSGKSRSIETALKSGDKVLVQVTKDPIGHKGARLTQQVNLPGRFLVYVPGGSMTGISRKLPDKERTRLKDILKKIVPDDAGVIIRTAAEGASEEELTRDVSRLQAQWEVIQTKAASTSNAPTLLYGEPDLAIRVIRDVFNEDFKRLVVQGSDAWDTVEAYVAHVSPELSQRLERYTGTGDVFRDLRIDEQLMKALDRKVWLPSGGSLVIDRTEAMTVVDVNTGKFVGSGGNLEQTVTRNNIEAAEEIVRQLRLRDIGGIIVIDFIDMVLESNRDLVLRRLTECLGRDRTKHQVAEVTSLGLVQMTRKRVGQGLLEVFSEPCEHCRGRGVLVHLDQPEGKKGNGGGNGNGGGDAGNGGRNRGGGKADGGRRNGGQQDAAETAGVDTLDVGPVSEPPSVAVTPVVEAPAVETPVVADAVVEAPAVEADVPAEPAGDDTRRDGGRRRGTPRREPSRREDPAAGWELADALALGGGTATAEPATEPVEPAVDEPVAEPAAEGRSGRRSRGRRGRGQSAEARTAEETGVTGSPVEQPTEQVAEPQPTGEPVEHATPDTVLAAVVAETEAASEASTELGAPSPSVESLTGETLLEETPVQQAPDVEVPTGAPAMAGPLAGAPTEAVTEVSTEAPAADPRPAPAVVVSPLAVAEPVPADAPPVARPRRRRAATRPAGPPAQ
ncbi:Rne/Rng family ribonuclease [Modestobacter sp. VKM Ac-2986]|uniref:Rne/Rng family ribonuclease n=1 Tax=Modestobacter sp. VKM Ac-2986 TaxID=3004140 RepID=UPI0022AAD278|nr:Rne/Rng family ribonuclease [Modestobacter sp. VKM Ac-2986]MCZ2828562.1 Rne/Rng family ribonuclease [Modestobacter sp. VKM Ac-2986]